MSSVKAPAEVHVNSTAAPASPGPEGPTLAIASGYFDEARVVPMGSVPPLACESMARGRVEPSTRVSSRRRGQPGSNAESTRDSPCVTSSGIRQSTYDCSRKYAEHVRPFAGESISAPDIGAEFRFGHALPIAAPQEIPHSAPFRRNYVLDSRLGRQHPQATTPSLRCAHAEFRLVDRAHVFSKPLELVYDKSLDRHVCSDRVPHRGEIVR